jgi:hypothetical protein
MLELTFVLGFVGKHLELDKLLLKYGELVAAAAVCAAAVLAYRVIPEPTQNEQLQ